MIHKDHGEMIYERGDQILSLRTLYIESTEAPAFTRGEILSKQKSGSYTVRFQNFGIHGHVWRWEMRLVPPLMLLAECAELSRGGDQAR